MALKFFNSFGNKLEEFKPIKKDFVGLYTCGPTVYNNAHIGNFKCYTWDDLIKRYLIFKGYKVKQVMNLTDIDDKTIKGAMQEKVPLRQYTEKYKRSFYEDVKALNLLPAEIYCAATDHIREMVALIQKLLDKGIAYRGEDGSIYFSIKKFPAYGKLAGVDIKKLKPGARVKQDEYEKEGVGDFALWKAWDENDGDVYWETLLGKGRPGWHIECSAMSMKYLGESFDMHTGGVDNKFPHHENEIAQSEGATGKKFVNYWLHTAHLMVNGQKMSKSAENFFTLRDLLDKGLNPMAIRYVFINTNYRQQLNFTFDSVKDAQKTLDGLQNFISRLQEITSKRIKIKTSSGVKTNGTEIRSLVDKALSGFVEAMDNDLNVPEAMKYVFELVKKANKLLDEGKLGADEAKQALDFMKRIGFVLGVLSFEAEKVVLTKAQQKLIDERTVAKKAKDWQRADEIRSALRRQGIELIDNKDGTTSAKNV